MSASRPSRTFLAAVLAVPVLVMVAAAPASAIEPPVAPGESSPPAYDEDSAEVREPTIEEVAVEPVDERPATDEELLAPDADPAAAEPDASPAAATATFAADSDDGFALIGVTWNGVESEGTTVRGRWLSEGTWSAWEPLPVTEGSAANGPRGTDAFWTGDAEQAEVELTSPDGVLPDGVTVNLVDPEPEEATQPEGTTETTAAAEPIEPAELTEPTEAVEPAEAAEPTEAAEPAEAVEPAEAAEPATEPVDGFAGALPAPAQAPIATQSSAGTRPTSVPQPEIRSRAQWGANESWRSGSPRYQDDVKALVVHHTAGSNRYSCADSAAVIRGIYAYDTRTLGWNDIAYNFLIDKCGVIWESAAGGVASSVAATHTGGFNSSTQAVALMGNYETAQAPGAMISSLVSLLAWKSSLLGIDPDGRTTLTQAGGNGTTARWRDGYTANVDTIFGHRTVGYTACPGRYVISQMGSIISRTAAAAVPPAPAAPRPPARPVPSVVLSNGYPAPLVGRVAYGRPDDVPLLCDWNGDGRDTVGIFRDGQWHLRNTNSDGPAQVSFTLGRAGDQPVCGDWDGNGTDTAGVVRASTFFLANRLRSGPADRALPFGRPSDTPIVGDWDGNGTDTPGVARAAGAKQIHVTNSTTNARTADSYYFGRVDDEVVTGDWDGNRRDTVGVFRRGSLFLTNSTTRPSAARSYTLGGDGDVPLAANLDAGTQDSVSVARDY